jgi:uncharacterized protein YgbK (DUF1537 family)
MLLGAIADDLTGATDLALMLSREGMRTIQVIGVPTADFDAGDADAVVVALKSRTIAATEAIEMSLQALTWLKAGGASQVLFKYCSTFDSTPKGNIGPVTEALMEALGTDLTIVCPAFPANGRTIYRGHLFVGDQLLSESPMKDHPLTPMTDASLVRLMRGQSSLAVGLVGRDVVAKGADAVRQAYAAARVRGDRALVVDAITDDDLRVIGEASGDLALITGGSGIAIGLPDNFRRTGRLSTADDAPHFEAPAGRGVILAGSCSQATRGQIAAAISAGTPAMKLDPLAIADGRQTVAEAVDWLLSTATGIPLIYSSSEAEEVKAAQKVLGRDRAGALIENFLADVAVKLRECGVTRFIIAGGETSGAVVTALKAPALYIGPEIDPGVPWTRSLGDPQPVALALKSGNFGTPDFFLKAWELLK